MINAPARAPSYLLAESLAGSWRPAPSPPEISVTELDEIVPLLLGAGAAGLALWRMRQSAALKETEAARRLLEVYRLNALQDVIHQNDIRQVFGMFRAAGIEPMLAKGWAIARQYPETALRPYGDLDLCVEPEQYRHALDLLRSSEAKKLNVDLHKGFSELQDRSLNEVFARSKLVKLGEAEVRVMGAEDHLCLLAVHLLKHGAWRPVWLCDIGAAVETRPADFDWKVCLGKDERRAGWILSTVGLAHKLLEANIEDTPVAVRARELPRWLLPNVLKQWETPFAVNQAPMKHGAPMASYLRNPRGLFKDLRKRWPDPITATVSLEGSFNNWPRLPYQLGNCLARASQFFRQLPSRLREQP